MAPLAPDRMMRLAGSVGWRVIRLLLYLQPRPVLSSPVPAPPAAPMPETVKAEDEAPSRREEDAATKDDDEDFLAALVPGCAFTVAFPAAASEPDCADSDTGVEFTAEEPAVAGSAREVMQAPWLAPGS